MVPPTWSSELPAQNLPTPLQELFEILKKKIVTHASVGKHMKNLTYLLNN